MDTVIIWHICDILWKFQPSSSIFRLWHLEAKIFKWSENGQNPKGGPLDEKNIFSTTFPDFIQIRLKRSETRCWFQKHIYQCTLWHWMSSYDITWHLMTADVIWWHQMSKIYWSTCFWNQHSISNHLSLFGSFWVFCPARFRKWQGVNLKIEISSFQQSFSFCELKIAW